MNVIIQFSSPLLYRRGGLSIDFASMFDGSPAVGTECSFDFAFDGPLNNNS